MRGPAGAGRATGAPACSPRRPRNSARSAVDRPRGTPCAVSAQPLARGATGRSGPGAGRRYAVGRASCPAARCRVARTDGRVLRGRRALFGTVRASHAAPLLLKLARLPAQLLLFLGLVVIRSGHEAPHLIAGSGECVLGGGQSAGSRAQAVQGARPGERSDGPGSCRKPRGRRRFEPITNAPSNVRKVGLAAASGAVMRSGAAAASCCAPDIDRAAARSIQIVTVLIPGLDRSGEVRCSIQRQNRTLRLLRGRLQLARCGLLTGASRHAGMPRSAGRGMFTSYTLRRTMYA